MSGVGGVTEDAAALHEEQLQQQEEEPASPHSSCSSHSPGNSSNRCSQRSRLLSQQSGDEVAAASPGVDSSRPTTPQERVLLAAPTAVDTSPLPSQRVAPRGTSDDYARSQQPTVWSQVVSPLMRHLITPASSRPTPQQQQQQLAGQEQPQQAEQVPHPLLVHMRLSSVIAANAAVRGSFSSLSSPSSAAAAESASQHSSNDEQPDDTAMTQPGDTASQPDELDAGDMQQGSSGRAGAGSRLHTPTGSGTASNSSSSSSSSSRHGSSRGSEQVVHSGAAEILFVHSRPASSNSSSVALDQSALLHLQQQELGVQLPPAGSGVDLSRCSSSSSSMVLQPCLTPTGPQAGSSSSRLSEAACAAAAAAGEAEVDGCNFLLQRFNAAAGADWGQHVSTAAKHQEDASAAYATHLAGGLSSGRNATQLQSAAGAEGGMELHLSPSWQQLAHVQRQRPDTSGVAVGVLASSRRSSAAGDAAPTAALVADAWQCTGGMHAFEHGNVQIAGLSLSFSTVSSSSSSSLSSVLGTAAVGIASSMPAGEPEQQSFGRFQPPVGQAPADMAALDAISPTATSTAAAAAWQDGHMADAPMFPRSTGARPAAEDEDEVCFSSPAPSLPPRLPTQSVTPKQSARTRSRTTHLLTPPANSILTASPGGSVRPLGVAPAAAAAAAGGAAAGGCSSWHAGMVLAASPFAAAGDDKPSAEMRFSVRHSLADTEGRPPVPAAAAAGMGATSRSCTDVMLLPARRSSSEGGAGVSTNCLFEPAPANPLELLPVPLHDGRSSSGGDAQLLPQYPSSSSIFSDHTAAAAAGTAGGGPRVMRHSSSSFRGSDSAAGAAADGGSAAGMGSMPGEQQPQLGSLLGGALHSLAALQGVLQEGQHVADALLGR
jgi:hypothetical protein